MLKKFFVVFGALVFLLFASAVHAERVVYDTFDMNTLSFTGELFVDRYLIYDILGDYEHTLDVTRKVYSDEPYTRAEPEIFTGFSTEGDNHSLYTGLSTLARDVHFKHRTFLTYHFKDELINPSFSFKYLNRRGVGGFVCAYVGYRDVDGNNVWLEKVPDSEISWGDIKNRSRWIHKIFSKELITTVANGRPVNYIFIQEWDITSELGGAYFDEIEIHADNNSLNRSLSETDTNSVFSACEVSIDITKRNRAYDYELYLENTNQFIFSSRGRPKESIYLGDIPHGTELIFRLDVLDTGESFYTGPSIRNSDGEDHVDIEVVGENKVKVGFNINNRGNDHNLEFVVTGAVVN